MLLTEAGCGLIAFILCISGIHGQTHICALLGSSVILTCSTKNLTSSNKWFTEHRSDSKLVYKELSADERHVIHTSDENQPILTIRNLTKSDAKVYCCGNTTEDPDLCRQRSTQLSVTDLQVIVSPVMSEQRRYDVKLTCSTSCNLTQSPSAYIWYSKEISLKGIKSFFYANISRNKPTSAYNWFSNEKTLNENKSFYYANVNRNKIVTYSCAVKEYYERKSPEVSLDLSDPKVLKVTYAKGEICLSQNKSEDESCSFTRSIGTNKPWKTDTTATAAAAGAGAVLLVVIPAVVFIWIRTKRTLERSSTTGEGDITPQLNSSHVYENIPVQPAQHDDVNYSTINFQTKEREHGAYAVVCFRPNV